MLIRFRFALPSFCLFVFVLLFSVVWGGRETVFFRGGERWRFHVKRSNSIRFRSNNRIRFDFGSVSRQVAEQHNVFNGFVDQLDCCTYSVAARMLALVVFIQPLKFETSPFFCYPTLPTICLSSTSVLFPQSNPFTKKNKKINPHNTAENSTRIQCRSNHHQQFRRKLRIRIHYAPCLASPSPREPTPATRRRECPTDDSD